LFEAYTYLPLAGAAIALAAAASKWNPAWAIALFALWLPMNVRQIHRESRALLEQDAHTRAFVTAMGSFARQYPQRRVLVYAGAPPGFHEWGVTAAWYLFHDRTESPAFWFDTPEARRALSSGPIAFTQWDAARQQFEFTAR
jgi:hypothetical protein